jgi:hypothetical protein
LETNNRCDFAPSKSRALGRTVRRTVALLACLAQAACASRPDSIEASYVSPTTFANWSCDQLFDEKGRLSKEVEKVSGLQRENANADMAMMTVGIIILWPVLLGLAATKDRKTELGRLKGEYEAVDLSIKSKRCSMPAPGETSVPVPVTEQTKIVVSENNGIYKGRGKTDSWCQSPTLNLVLRAGAVEGSLSEVTSGTPTSTIQGTVDATGVVGLDIKANGTSANYFTGKVDGVLTTGSLSLTFKTKTAQACTYAFQLTRE